MKTFAKTIALVAASMTIAACAQAPVLQAPQAAQAPLTLSAQVQNGNVTFDAQHEGGG